MQVICHPVAGAINLAFGLGGGMITRRSGSARRSLQKPTLPRVPLLLSLSEMNPTTSVPAAVAVPAEAVAAKRAGNQALAMIAVFKLSKAVLFFAVAFGLLRMIDKDTAVELKKLLHVFRIDGDRGFIKDLLVKANVIENPQKKLFGALAAISGVMFCIEGVGLMLRKKWAEYLTVILTSGGIPIELYEIFHRTAHVAGSKILTATVPEEQRAAFVFDKMMLLKIGALLLNSLIVWFLVSHLRRTHQTEKALADETGALP